VPDASLALREHPPGVVDDCNVEALGAE